MAESFQAYYGQDNKRLFEILFDDLSLRAQHTLLYNGINSVEDLAPWIEGEFNSFTQYKKCGRRTSEELMGMVLRLRKSAEASSQPICEGDALNGDEHTPKETQTEKFSERDKQLFEFLFNDLSSRAQNILLYHDINCIEKLAPWIQGEYNSFLKFRNCGKRTSEELMEMVLYLRAKVDLSCQSDDKSVSVNQEKGQGSLETIDKAVENIKPLQKHFDRLFYSLSVRARNVLSTNGIINVETFLSFTNQPFLELLKYRNCGKKTVLELLEAKERLLLLIIRSEITDKDTVLPFDNIIQFDLEEQKFLSAFKKEYGHWPMMYILFSLLVSLLKPREFAAFEEKYGIRKHEELEKLTKQRVQQIFETASKKLQTSSSLKQLCEFEDWDLYYVNNIPTPVFEDADEDNTWLEVENMISQEKTFLNNCFNEKESAEGNHEKQSELLSHINISTFKVFLLFWGHLPLWLGKFCLVSYCPQERKGYYDPQSPIVIDKRYASFNFSKSTAEIGRLKKEKTANDIILSIEKYFVDNEDYWKRSVYLSNKDKAALVLILKRLFRDVYHAIIDDDNLVFKANRVDFRDKLYGILSTEGTRLHRDELFKRLKKAYEEQGVQCDFSDSSQITTFLTKDPRIIPYGKSSYWGLKEWGESNGSIRDLALQFVKKSNEPIHIDDLTQLIMESRPDSNGKSISSIIRQTTSTRELLLFWGDYIGYPNAKYDHEFILMPRSFDEWLKAFKEFVLKNKRYPNNDKGFEGFLNRWYQRAIKLTDLSAEEILKIDTLEKELTHYPHNTIEYNFLHNCNLYQLFVEGNNRVPKKEDDSRLYTWFYIASRNYNSYNDNRNKYFSQLLQYLSSKLY